MHGLRVTSSDCERDLQGILTFHMNVFLLAYTHAWSAAGHIRAVYLHDNGSSDNVVHGAVVKHVLDVQVKVLLVGADGPHQLCDVVGVQSAGLSWQTAGQVCVANVSHSLKETTKAHILLYCAKLEGKTSDFMSEQNVH